MEGSTIMSFVVVYKLPKAHIDVVSIYGQWTFIEKLKIDSLLHQVL